MKYFSLVLSIIFGLLASLLSLGYIEVFFGIITPNEIPIALENTLEFFDAKWRLIGQDIGSIIFIIVSIILAVYFYSLYHRLNKKKKDTYQYESIKEPFVLYLRSFIDDNITRKRVFMTDVRSEEEVLVDVLSEIAPVYAIGDPRDDKMPIGASRIYVEDAHWKDTVEDLAKRASVVVLRLGKTDSFWWEVEMAVKKVSIGKILFVIPESKTFSNVANLYKILLENNIDINQLDITVEKQLSGSISSFLYFDKDNNSVTKEVKTQRFSRFILSYKNILKNSLTDFLSKYGLKTRQKHIIKIAPLIEFSAMIFMVFVIGSQMLYDYSVLKHQMPREFVEKCIENPKFVSKYSDEINGNNLAFGIAEANRGMYGIDELSYKLVFLIEYRTLMAMSAEEYEQLQSSPKNMLLMVKKYCPDDYDMYINILNDAINIAIQYPDDIDELIHYYKQSVDALPQWVIDLSNTDNNFEDEYNYILWFDSMIHKHFDDDEIVDVLKVLSSQLPDE